MRKINCFDVVSMVVEEATLQFQRVYVFDQEKYRMLEKCCSALDCMADETSATQFEAEILETDKTVSLSLWCTGLTVDCVNHSFCYLIQQAISCTVSCEDEEIKINFVFPTLWNYKSNSNF